MKYAIVESDIVTATMVPSYVPDAPWVQVPDVVETGWEYDGTTFSAPTAPPTTTYQTVMTPLEYLQSFNDVETAAIYAAESSDVTVRILLDRVRTAQFIDVSDPATILGLGYLVSQGHITQVRADEIALGIEVTS